MASRDLRCFPKDDAAFRVCAEDLAGHLDGLDDGAVADALTTALRAFYPGARVIRQTPLGSTDPRVAVFYAYRDGSVISVEKHRQTPEP